MILNMYEHDVLIYAALILGGIGLLSKLILSFSYSRLLRAAKEMGTSENKLMKLIRLKFDACYKLKLGVHNVDTFVDKYVYGYKFCGISLYTLHNISGQVITLCTIIALFGSVLAYLTKCGQDVILSTLGVGIGVAVLLAAVDNLLSLKAKQRLLRIHMKDYLDNNLKAKLENQYFSPKELEEYRNSYFEREETKKEDEALEGVKQRAGNAEDEKIIEDILKEYLV